jgi:hypothetical protein
VSAASARRSAGAVRHLCTLGAAISRVGLARGRLPARRRVGARVLLDRARLVRVGREESEAVAADERHRPARLPWELAKTRTISAYVLAALCRACFLLSFLAFFLSFFFLRLFVSVRA